MYRLAVLRFDQTVGRVGQITYIRLVDSNCHFLFLLFEKPFFVLKRLEFLPNMNNKGH